MADKQIIKGKMEIAGIMGPLWFTGWLFTVGYLGLPLVKALFAALVWPYFLGTSFR
ncbi:MAG: hypothetical protein HKN21_13460 [Candidatus Eisenbacteria bacterium]|uniref:Uncharacterized protein n=1 Tax=Eiseniibacteriota bacterium TaxID=2212470 RepID=A0A7Y2EAX0_UNCEI|nr:hypothetical protein [Candidatus Eisenbacteria bacterium]